jgi:hypothetical protein
MLGPLGQNDQERELSATIALTKGMNRVYFRKKVGSLTRESPGHEPSELFLVSQFRENSSHLAIDVLRIAERVAAFGNPHCADFPSPWLHVLEQVPVDRTIMTVAEPAGRKRLGRPVRCHLCFERIKLRLIPGTKSVNEDGRSRVTVRIRLRPIHAGVTGPCDMRG